MKQCGEKAKLKRAKGNVSQCVTEGFVLNNIAHLLTEIKKFIVHHSKKNVARKNTNQTRVQPGDRVHGTRFRLVVVASLVAK
jgi:hypothetical protein